MIRPKSIGEATRIISQLEAKIDELQEAIIRLADSGDFIDDSTTQSEADFLQRELSARIAYAGKYAKGE